MHKKGLAGNMLSIGYFFFLLVIIAVPLFIIAKVIFEGSYDNRMDDASLFAYKIGRCLENNPNLKNSDFSTVLSLEDTCDVKFNGLKVVLYISSENVELFKYGDRIACELYELSEKNPRCVETSVKGLLDGKEEVFHILAGSNLEVKNE